MDIDINSLLGSMNVYSMSIIIGVILIISIVIMIKKLKFDMGRVFSSLGYSLLALVIVFLFLIVISFVIPGPVCKGYVNNVGCPTNADILIENSYFLVPIAYLLIIFIYYLVNVLRKLNDSIYSGEDLSNS